MENLQENLHVFVFVSRAQLAENLYKPRIWW